MIYLPWTSALGNELACGAHKFVRTIDWPVRMLGQPIGFDEGSP